MSKSSRPGSCLTADKPGEKQISETSDILSSSTGRYLVRDFMGEGVFGKVAKCINLTTGKEVALKIFKTERIRVIEREIQMLEVVSVLDPVKKNVVDFFEKFEHRGQACLAFEKLDKTIFQLVKERKRKPLSLSEIRPIAQQLLTAFAALKEVGVVHADLKPDNVMLVNHEDEPFRVKLIDFGLSFRTFEDKRGLSFMPLSCRAPEVVLGLPVSEAVDMWALGCLLAYLYLGKPLFKVRCEYRLITSVIEILGQPADYLLCEGNHTKKFFKENRYWDSPKWWLKTPNEYQQETGVKSKDSLWSVGSLEELITLYPERQKSTETEDCRAFVSLLKCLLRTDPEQRISPEKALKHPFVSMVHLEEETNTSLYLEDARNKMMVCPMDDLEKELVPEDEAEEEPEAEGSPVILCSSAQDSAASGSCDGSPNMPCSNDEAAAAGVQDTAGSAEEEPAVNKDAATAAPAEETATGGEGDEGEPVKVKKSRLKRIRKFFGRVTRTIFRKKK